MNYKDEPCEKCKGTGSSSYADRPCEECEGSAIAKWRQLIRQTPSSCKWTSDTSDGTWYSSCGEACPVREGIAGTFIYCPFCGAILEGAKT